ncbi:MAG TPA: DUF3551 domain-containing protein [Xanthobacteraceae bacterium]
MKPLSIVFGICAACLAMTPPALGQNYPWCSNFHDGGGTNCGFSSREQCMATAQGSGGTCARNNVYAPSVRPQSPRRATRRHGPGRHF